MALSLEVVVPAAIARMVQNPEVLMNALRAHSPEIAQQIETRIRARTPRLTGALREAVSSNPYTNEVNGLNPVMLVRWYADDGPQLEVWGRVYVEYQEGEPLGKRTYTNDAHQMFEDVEVDDIPLIQAWAEAVVQDAANKLGG